MGFNDLLVEWASSGHLKNCNFGHQHIWFIFSTSVVAICLKIEFQSLIWSCLFVLALYCPSRADLLFRDFSTQLQACGSCSIVSDFAIYGCVKQVLDWILMWITMSECIGHVLSCWYCAWQGCHLVPSVSAKLNWPTVGRSFTFIAVDETVVSIHIRLLANSLPAYLLILENWSSSLSKSVK